MKKWKNIRYMCLLSLLCLLTFCLTGCFKSKGEESKEESVPKTVGNILAADFEDYLEQNPDVTAQEMADHILANSIIEFEGASMPVEEGLLMGFNNAEITGFEEGVMFAPMIGSIPFLGYVFTLEEGADADAFVKLLEDNADPRWNICTEAEETVTKTAERMVFFVMSPSQFE